MELSEHTAVLYLRKSTASDGKSLREQERENRQWCQANNIPVEKVFVDDGIGAARYGTKTRDAWGELKTYLRPGHILVAWEASRATRDAEEGARLLNLCAEKQVPLAFSGRVLDPSMGDDRFMGNLFFNLSARESDLLRERVLRGMRGAAADGTPHGRAPWGYRAVPRIPGSRPQWELDPVEGPRAREAAHRVLRGESRNTVLAWLRATGHAPASSSSFGRWLINPQIAALRVHQDRIVGKGKWPAIITENEHNALVASSKALTVTPGPESKTLCSGIAKCGKCGTALRWRGAYQQGRRQKRNPAYSCKNGCCARQQELVDELVTAAVLRRMRNIDPNVRNINPADEAQQRISALEKDLEDWIAKSINEEVSATVFAQIEKDRRAKIAALRPKTQIARRNILTAETWDGGSMADKRRTVRALLDIRVHPTKIRGGKLVSEGIDIKPIKLM